MQPTNKPHLDDKLLNEFQQGNFSNLRDTKLSDDAITDILLQHPATPEKLQTDILNHMIAKCGHRNSTSQSEEDITAKVREHNDNVRVRLLRAFKSADPRQLKKHWLEKRSKFDKRYRKEYWGLSIKEAIANQASPETKDIQEHLRKERVQRIIKCIKKLNMSNITNKEHMLDKLRQMCKKQELAEAKKMTTTKKKPTRK